MNNEFFFQPKTYDTSSPYKAILRSTDRITPEDAHDEVRQIVLNVPAASLVYVEGQSIGVLAPPPYEFGNDHHMRLYSIASARRGEEGQGTEIAMCIRRCFYIDEVRGERYPGKGSKDLCVRGGAAEVIRGPGHGALPHRRFKRGLDAQKTGDLSRRALGRASVRLGRRCCSSPVQVKNA